MEEKEQKILTKLFEIASTLSSTLDIDALLKRIGDAAEQLTGAEASSIMLLDEDKTHLSFKIASGEKGMIVKKMKIKIGEGVAGWIAQNKKPLIVNDVNKDERFSRSFDKTSGFQTRSLLGVPLILGNELIGVAEVLNKKEGKEFTEEDEKILTALAGLASISISNARFAENQKNFFVYMIEIIVQAIESINPKTIGHTWRVAKLATEIARAMNITGNDYKNLYYASLLHDIGFLTGRKSISLGEDIFTINDENLEKTHPLAGYETIIKINILRESAPIIRSHHENFDGSGFPDALEGSEIPLLAQILSLAEYIDELSMEGYDEKKIRSILKAQAGKKFAPEFINTYLNEIAPVEETV